ncbi:MAG: RidA family protein [Alphaproteobacteria bacterium]|nr:RidA family protein [Alphaproteobacteria bacterium]
MAKARGRSARSGRRSLKRAAVRRTGRPVVGPGRDGNGYRVKLRPDIYDGFNIALGYRVGDLVYLSGQASLDLKTGAIVGVGDFDRQVKQTFASLKTVLKAAGSSMRQIVKVNIYLTDMANFPKIVAARGKYFKQPWPADTIVEVQALGLPELMIEIEAIALVGGRLID